MQAPENVEGLFGVRDNQVTVLVALLEFAGAVTVKTEVRGAAHPLKAIVNERASSKLAFMGCAL